MDLRQLDKKYFGRQGEPEDVIVGGSADSYLTDARGRKYIDFMMGWCVGNLGWGNTEIRAAARKFDGPDYVHPDYLYRPWVQLAEMLARTTPGQARGLLSHHRRHRIGRRRAANRHGLYGARQARFDRGQLPWQLHRHPEHRRIG